MEIERIKFSHDEIEELIKKTNRQGLTLCTMYE